MRVPSLPWKKTSPQEPSQVTGDAPARLVSSIESTESAAAHLKLLAETTRKREEQQRTDDDRALTRAAKRREIQSRALLDAAADRVRFDIDDLLESGTGYGYEDWDSDIWSAEYDQPVDVTELVKAGTLGLASPTNIVELPFTLPVLGSSLLITHEPGGQAAANSMAQGFVVRALSSALPGSLRVHLIDPAGLGQNLGILSRIPEPLTTGGVRATRDEVSNELDAVRDHVHRLNSQVLLGEHDSLVTRWHEGTANGIPCSMILATGLGTGMNFDDIHQLWALARTGQRCGVSVVAVLDSTRNLPHGVTLADLTEHAEHIHVDNDGGAIWDSAPPLLHHNARIRCPKPPGSHQHRFLADILAPAVRLGANRPVMLAEQLEANPPGHGQTFTTISAPIGQRADGSPIELGVGDDEDVAIGGLIVGPSGSGKTTLLHALIHSLAHRYSPAELEMYLLDMKAGVEFAEYAPRAERPALPHIRAVGIEADPNFALGVLEHLLKVDAERKQLFKQESIRTGQEIKNIAQYRKVTGKQLPRVLFIADEFQLMLAGPTEDSAWDALDVLAKQGRSQGIHLLLATQSLNSVGMGRGSQKASVFDQLELRVGLRCKPDELSNLFDRMVRGRLDTGRRGSGVLNQERGDPDSDQIFQAGLLDTGERAQIRERLVKTFGHDPRIRVSRGSGGVELEDTMELLQATTVPTIYVGAPVGVEPPLVGFPAQPGDGRGLLITGRDEAQAISSVSAMLVSLALQPACQDANFVVVDLLPQGIPGRESIDHVVTWLGDKVSVVTDDRLDELQAVASGNSGPTFVALLGLQYTAAEVPYFSSDSDPVHPFTWLCGSGPSQKVFPLIWLDTPDRKRKLGPDADRLQLRAFSGGDIIETSAFLERRPPYTTPRGRMWFHDLTGDGEPVLVDPFRVSASLPDRPAAWRSR